MYADEVNVIDIQMSILLLLDSTQRMDAKTFNSVLKLLYGSLSNRRDRSILNTSMEINSLPDNIGNLLRLVKSNLDQVLHPVRDILTPQTPLVLVERIVDSFLDGVEKCSTFDPNSSFQEDFAVNQTKMINSFKEKLLPQTIRSAFQSKIVRIDTPHPPVENITGRLENDFSKFIESVYQKTNTTISFTDQAEISFNKCKNENIEELSSIKLLTKLPNLDTNSLIDFRRENRELRSLYWSTIREYAQILRSSENETSAELVADRIEKEYIKKYSEFFP
ncbi:hypothetical protein [Corynebacterium mastitidis]|uniref:hypothetical protein n=1 Tax=Corynebacterium mastitidis TaxID=161890 RepID=UPI00254A44B7|nr:hypothetical protein [Corynebacterium mastitidis]MDK8449687.1 hypothetical protein [Corynebacterium mastitidis]